MLTLGISTSAKEPSAAVAENGEIICIYKDESGRSHSTVLMGLIESALNKAGAGFADISAIAVDIGPGSFTGVRIGVSCANAMAMALGIPVIPVSSLAALRHSADERGTVCSLIDCRNGNCYAAVYENGAEKLAPCAAVTNEILHDLPDDAVITGNCCGMDRAPDARLVLVEAALNGRQVREAVPMYLRPSQAERMKGQK